MIGRALLVTVATASIARAQSSPEHVVNIWLDAQNRGDLYTYEQLYAPEFRGVLRSGKRALRLNRTQWLVDRRRMFLRPMKVTASGLAIDGPVVTFTQTFESGRLRDEGPRRMVLVQKGPWWHIAAEEVLPSPRTADLVTAAVRSLVERWERAQEDGSADDFRDLYGEGFRGTLRPGAAPIDRAGWMTWWEPRLRAGMPVGVTISDLRIADRVSTVEVRFACVWEGDDYRDEGEHRMVLAKAVAGTATELTIIEEEGAPRPTRLSPEDEDLVRALYPEFDAASRTVGKDAITQVESDDCRVRGEEACLVALVGLERGGQHRTELAVFRGGRMPTPPTPPAPRPPGDVFEIFNKPVDKRKAVASRREPPVLIARHSLDSDGATFYRATQRPDWNVDREWTPSSSSRAREERFLIGRVARFSAEQDLFAVATTRLGPHNFDYASGATSWTLYRVSDGKIERVLAGRDTYKGREQMTRGFEAGDRRPDGFFELRVVRLFSKIGESADRWREQTQLYRWNGRRYERANQKR